MKGWPKRFPNEYSLLMKFRSTRKTSHSVSSKMLRVKVSVFIPYVPILISSSPLHEAISYQSDPLL